MHYIIILNIWTLTPTLRGELIMFTPPKKNILQPNTSVQLYQLPIHPNSNMKQETKQSKRCHCQGLVYTEWKILVFKRFFYVVCSSQTETGMSRLQEQDQRNRTVSEFYLFKGNHQSSRIRLRELRTGKNIKRILLRYNEVVLLMPWTQKVAS